MAHQARTEIEERKMAEETGGIDGNEALVNSADTMPQIGLISQYVKDLSFENPNSPVVYQWQGQPQIDVQFNIGSNQFADDIFEEIGRASCRERECQYV